MWPRGLDPSYHIPVPKLPDSRSHLVGCWADSVGGDPWRLLTQTPVPAILCFLTHSDVNSCRRLALTMTTDEAAPPRLSHYSRRKPSQLWAQTNSSLTCLCMCFWSQWHKSNWYWKPKELYFIPHPVFNSLWDKDFILTKSLCMEDDVGKDLWRH